MYEPASLSVSLASCWAGLVLSYSSPFLTFELGTLFTHWIADSLTLWKSPITDEHLWTAASYYSILAKGPSQILYFLAAVVILGGTTILWSLNDLQAENIMFDGGSICKSAQLSAFFYPYLFLVLFGTTIAMYLYSVLPSMSTGTSDPFTSILSELQVYSQNLVLYQHIN